MNTGLTDILLSFLKYLSEDEDGVKTILTWIYNAIMQVEADIRPAVKHMSGTRIEGCIVTVPEPVL